MAYVTNRGVRYNSTIDTGPLAIIEATDVHDSEAVRRCGEAVRESLPNRVPEELVGTGRLDRRYATLRLHGSIVVLERRRRQALAVGALPEAVAVIDLVLAEARRARDLAASYTPPDTETEKDNTTTTTLRQAWTLTVAPEEHTLSKTVTLRELLDDLATEGGVTTDDGE